MSHFCTLVLVNPKTQDVQRQVEKLLAPFNEELEVPEYDRTCFCVGKLAQREAEARMEAELGTWAQAREEFARETELLSEQAKVKQWRETVQAPRVARIEELVARHPQQGQPDPGCEKCQGTGTYLSEYNPQSKWDWWVIGGRWTGFLDGYDPTADPINQETCYLCNGTGVRPGGREEFGDAWFEETGGCNGCQGTGVRVKWDLAKHQGDVMRVSQIGPDKIPFAVVTPDGAWHERGEMGWFAFVANEKDEDDWAKQVHELLAHYPDHLAVVCDLHI